ncbi:MAG: hypothetical protein PHI55_09755, partial [Burkholderiaceae bacterium]|nr:hypothetical protein [Burkholderiaceae bacterium]
VLVLIAWYRGVSYLGLPASWKLALYLGALGAVMAAAGLYHRGIERPLYQRLRRWLQPRTAQAA